MDSLPVRVVNVDSRTRVGTAASAQRSSRGAVGPLWGAYRAHGSAEDH